MVRISDARMSGTAFGTIILHVSPEAALGGPLGLVRQGDRIRSEEHTSELQSLMRISYAVFCLKKKKQPHTIQQLLSKTEHNKTYRLIHRIHELYNVTSCN